MTKAIPVHPGITLRNEFMAPKKLSASGLAVRLQLNAPRVNDIVRGMRGITADTALRLARYFGNTADYWMKLQADYEILMAKAEAGERIEHITPASAEPEAVEA